MMAPNWQFFDPTRHAQALESLALQALGDDDLTTAFACADRRCRILPIPQAHHYTLRAEISYRMGEHTHALSDLQTALAMEPRDMGVNRRLLAWGEGPLRSAAARMLIANDGDLGSIAKALAVLVPGTENTRAFGAATILDGAVIGWAAWRGSGQVELVVFGEDGRAATALCADEAHPLRHCLGHATTFNIPRTLSAHPQTVVLEIDGEAFWRATARPSASVPSAPANMERAARKRSNRITVIVPVYGDYTATRRCLADLPSQLGGSHRAIVVDDASPDPRIRELVRDIGDDPRISCIFHAENMGFVGAVNRALRQIDDGDVLLLNSDTILPPRLLARLAAVAATAPDIGTVTPLSNNGEFTSFPRPNESNPMGSKAQVLAIDRIAAAVNAGAVVDIPNGIGFCLYITRRCLDAVGALSETLHRGYLEDVDLCLRARELGFRNACAPSIYVGHAGSRSFGDEKRALVVRNLHTIESRYPRYREECASYLVADPIRPYRQAVERALPPRTGPLRLLVSGPGLLEEIVAARADELADAATGVLALCVRFAPSGPIVRLREWGGGAPQSLAFELEQNDERAALKAYIEAAAPELVEIAGLATIPTSLLDLIGEIGIAYDLLVVDGSILCHRGTMMLRDGSICEAPTTGAVCADCAPPGAELMKPTSDDELAKRSRFIEKARRVRPLSRAAAAFVARFMPGHGIDSIELPQAPSSPSPLVGEGRGGGSGGYAGEVPHLATPTPDPSPQGGGEKTHSPATDRMTLGWRSSTEPRQAADEAPGQTFGFFLISATAAEQRLTLHVARWFKRERPETALVALGTTLDDLGLMKAGNLFVSGQVPRDDLARAIRQYDVKALFLPIRQPLFGHPIIVRAEASGLPLGHFDWSSGTIVPRAGDLGLDPRLADEDVARRLAQWFESQ
jgi:O-antigen biosynthesis protein